jgi:hypothetical protein
MMENVLVRHTLIVEGFECTVTKLMPTYPLLTKSRGPFAKIIALPGQSESSEAGRTPATAPASCGRQTKMGSDVAGGNGNASRRG